MRLDFDDNERAIIDRANKMESEAKDLRQTAYDKRDAREREWPIKDRLTFAATWRCVCGHGMAYDPLGEVRSDKDSPFKMAAQWECSAILLGIADRKLLHTPPAPFAFWDVKSENELSAGGVTTRAPADPSPDAFRSEPRRFRARNNQGANDMNAEMIGGAVRAVLAALGGYFVGTGAIDNETAQQFAGAGAVIATALWSIWAKRGAA